jgi:hypothetical protein
VQPYRVLLTALIVASLALASSPAAAKCWMWWCQPQQEIPGGPKVVKLPDLVVDDIKVLQTKCEGNHKGLAYTVVAIRNKGLGTFVWQYVPYQGGLYDQWSWPFAGSSSVAPGPTTIPSGSTKTVPDFGIPLGVRAVVKPDKSSSSFAIVAKVNPVHSFAEFDYSNNTKLRIFTYEGEFCP